MPEHSNHLIHETSPYLLQHAHNPVNWFAWSDEALNKAKKENKPILVSIGYAACHWCHVMEKESFEDEATAAIMNEHFVNIKIDREERPDLDHIYMDAVQAMTGSGGWPLNVFLTPDAKPFYGGTYFPPKRAFNRPSWQEILRGVIASFNERRDEIDKQAETLTEHLVKSNAFGLDSPEDPALSISMLDIDETAENLLKSGDREWGGFGNAPKFPQSFSIVFLLRYHLVKSGRQGKPGPALAHAMLSLDKMIQGGIYDQVGGGFARYSTDAEWLAPHFEKMLYDNALLISALSEAYQLTGKPRYKEVIEETIRFIQRELLYTADGTGFYSALDADSEGEEGRFYVWDPNEVKEILGDDADVYSSYYDISTNGNWEGKNILRVKEPLEEFSVRKNVERSTLKDLLKRSSERLLEQRKKRVRPLLDDKIILAWNALMNTACSKAFEATGNEEYRELAIGNMQFLLQKFNAGSDNELRHVWSRGGSKYPAFLDDYAFLIEALIHLQEITSDKVWLKKAEGLTKYVIAQFGEEETGFFYYTPSGQTDVIVRKKELYDGAVPSGNSAMARNLYLLSILTGRNDWKERSLKMLGSLGKAIVRYPGSFGNWAALLQEILKGTAEIVIIGPEYRELVEELLKDYVPHRVLLAGRIADPTYPMMAEKEAGKMSLIWLCKDFRCLLPVGSVKALRALIDSPDSFN